MSLEEGGVWYKLLTASNNNFYSPYDVYLEAPSQRELSAKLTEGANDAKRLIYFNFALLLAVSSWLMATQMKITPSISVDRALISGVPPERRPV